LDSVEQEAALWLPSEAQLRELLGGAFVQLTRDGGSYQIELDVDGHRVVVSADDPQEAYGRALLYLATGEVGEGVLSD
jgi:hypothetical protein